MSTPRGTWHPAIADKSEGAGAGWVAGGSRGGSRVVQERDRPRGPGARNQGGSRGGDDDNNKQTGRAVQEREIRVGRGAGDDDNNNNKQTTTRIRTAESHFGHAPRDSE